jgi:hypothetical protein
VHDKGYEMAVPMNASTVVVVIAHHARHGQVSRSVSWKKTVWNEPLTLHKQAQKRIVDVNWHLRYYEAF